MEENLTMDIAAVRISLGYSSALRLCSSAMHFTLTVPLFTQEYNIVLVTQVFKTRFWLV